MTKEGFVEDAKNKLADAAKVGAEGVKAVGSEALTAAATAAAGVVLHGVSQALGAGQQKAQEAIPQMQAPSPDRDELARRPARGRRRRRKRQGPAPNHRSARKRSAKRPERQSSGGNQLAPRKPSRPKRRRERRRGEKTPRAAVAKFASARAAGLLLPLPRK